MAFFQIDGNYCIDPKAIRLEPLHPFSLGWFGKVNAMHLYRGKRPSECHLLIDKTTLDSLNTVNGSHTIDISLLGDKVDLSTKHWTITHVEAIGQQDVAGQIFYIILKDPRHMVSTVAKTPPQVIANTWEEELWPNSSTYTYQQVLEKYWELMPSFSKANSVACPQLATVPASYAENIWCEGETVWDCICRILAACGHVGVFDPVSGTYSFLQADAAQPNLSGYYDAVSSLLVWDGDVPASLNAGNGPSSVGVSFRPSRTTMSFRLPHSVDEYGSKQSIATLLPGARYGTVLNVTDTSRTKYCSETSIIKNQKQLDNRTQDLAKTIRGVVRSQHTKKLRVYDGLVYIKPGEEVTHVSYKTDKTYGLISTVEHYEDFEILLPDPRNQEWDVSKLLVCKTTQVIPAMSGSTPGVGLAQVYGKPGSTLAEIPYETVTIKNIRTDSVSSDVWVLVSLEFNSGEYFIVERGYAGADATPTTTTLVPEFPSNCLGTCRWTSADGIAWTIDQNNCSNPTTTSTTAAATTLPPGSTTSSTTAHPCAAATSTTISPTSTTAAPGNCECVPPTFCPLEAGDCTTTYCDRDFTYDTPCTTSTTPAGTTTTTTPCDCSTSTTGSPTSTTYSPECGGGCTWCLLPNGTITFENNCSSNCPCGPYPGGLSSICSCVSTPCVPTTSIPPPPPPNCTGRCYWVCLGEGRGWWYDGQSSDCSLTGDCRCSYPTDSDSCPCGASTSTPCVRPTTTSTTTVSPPNPCDLCYTTTSTSTSTTADPCPGPCTYRWDSELSQWSLIQSYCGECGCEDPPIEPGEGSCEVITTGCNWYTTAPPTTTTTTAVVGSCCYPGPYGGCVTPVRSEYCVSTGGTFYPGTNCGGVNFCSDQTSTTAAPTTSTSTSTSTTSSTTTTPCPCQYASCGCVGGPADPLCAPGSVFSCEACGCTTTTTGIPTTENPPLPP